MNTKGLSTLMIILIVAVSSIVVIGGGYLIYNAATLADIGRLPVADVDIDGEFDDVVVPEDVGGTDLVANLSYSVTSEAFTVDFTTDTDINQTDGTVHTLAFNFEVSGGGITDFDADGELASTIATTEATIKKVYVMMDEEGLTLDSENSLSNFVVDLDTDLDKFGVETDYLDDGEYIFVIELKALTADTVAVSEELMSIDFTCDSDDSDATDEGTVTIYNHA